MIHPPDEHWNRGNTDHQQRIVLSAADVADIGREHSTFVNQCSSHNKGCGTYAKTYDRIVIPALRTIVPTQSMSKASCFHIVRKGLG